MDIVVRKLSANSWAVSIKDEDIINMIVDAVMAARAVIDEEMLNE